MNPIAAQQMCEYEMIRRSGGSASASASASSRSTAASSSDMSMALVVYKRPDLITPINVNDYDESDCEFCRDKKNKNKKRSSNDGVCVSSPSLSSLSYPCDGYSGMGYMASSSASASSFYYGGGYSSSSSSSDGGDMELD